MSLLWSLCQRCNSRHALLAGNSQATCQAPRTLTPPPAFKCLQHPSSRIHWLSSQDPHRLNSTDQSSISRFEPQSSHAEPQSVEQELDRALQRLRALRLKNRHTTPPRYPKIKLNYGDSHSHCPSFEQPASSESANTVCPDRDSILDDDQTIYNIISDSLEPEETDHLSEGFLIAESADKPTATPLIKRLSPQDCYTPSEALLYSLGPIAQSYGTFRDFAHKVDLSLVKPSNLARFGPDDATRIPENQTKESGGFFFPTVRKSLPTLLAEYLRSCWPTRPDLCSTDIGPDDIASSQHALQNVFSEENIAFLHNEGYEPEDLISWAWIVSADSTDRAAGRLMALSADSRFDSNESRAIPTFVFLFVLRRRYWSAHALRMMVTHGWQRLEWHSAARGNPLDPAHEFLKIRATSLQPGGIYQRFMSKKNAVMMVIRLLRHARNVSPEAYVSIAAMLTRHEGNFWDTPLKRSNIAETTFLYNTILALLALPTSMYPFLSITAKQEAQFVVVRRMNEFDPPLAIDRQGHRAMIRVQLAHKKTLQERDWASLKAKSWPPWKQDKLGHDSEKDFQYGQSRASQAIKSLEQAGYAVQDWEASAEILAGWDTDKSPTIQKRSLYSRPIIFRGKVFEKGTLRGTSSLLQWVARIHATRTIDEAWACFLAFKDTSCRHGIPSKASKVYFAMAEIIILEQRRLKATENCQLSDTGLRPGNITPLPGDGYMVFERPGPQENIYVRSSAPDLDEFFDMMLKDKVELSPRFLALLLSHARSFRKGVHYLHCSHLTNPEIKSLLHGDPKSMPCPIHEQRMPNYLFSAIIHFLTMFAPKTNYTGPTTFYIPGFFGRELEINSLLQACKLMSAYKPFYRPSWNALLLALGRKYISLETSNYKIDREIQDLLAWKATLGIVNDMQMIGLGLEFSNFRNVCIGYQKAVMAHAELTDAADLTHIRRRLDCDVETFIHDGLSFIKDLFKGIVFGGPSSQAGVPSKSSMEGADYQLPRLLETPSPSHIHSFIRILGLREDHMGIVELVEWMADFAPELRIKADELMNGKPMLRRCLTAAVVYLEQSWLPPEERIPYGEHCDSSTFEEFGQDSGRTIQSESTDHTKNGPAGTLTQRFRRAIDKNPDWGGWPSDLEIDTYVTYKRNMIEIETM